MADEVEYDVEVLRAQLMQRLEAAGNRVDLFPSHLAERFPRILAKIIDLWGKPELDTYFQKDLLTTNRPNRQGFSFDIGVELFRLSNLHSSFGLTPEKPIGAWDWEADSGFQKKHSDAEEA